MNKVETKYDELAVKAAIAKATIGKISPYITKMYDMAKDQIDITLEQFAARLANWNAGKEGIGQKAQATAILSVRPTFAMLKNAGKGSVFLYDTGNDIVIRKYSNECVKTNIVGTKTFDGKDEDNEWLTLYILKTIDIGSFSDNKGGGHQDNVETEIKTILKNIASRSFTFNDKTVKFVVMIDGRSAKNIIDNCISMIGSSDNIRIGTFDDLFGEDR
jgi:hypothetical protein